MQLAEERRQQIVDTVERQGKVMAAELALRFHTSEDTIRRDLRDLDAAGLLRRVHGGAMRRTRAEPAFSQRADADAARKGVLARVLAESVQPGDTVLVDAGTTNLAFARLLEDGHAAAVVTNSLQIALALGHFRATRVILLGGLVSGHAGAALGAHTVAEIRRLRVNLAVVGACSVEADRGLGASDAEEAAVKAAMLAAASRRAVAVLNERLEAPAPFLVAPLAEIDRLVLEADAPADVLARLRRLDPAPEVLLAGRAGA
ncbi:DeoR/GlpR transcriptional regulator [Massilia forsythiae]|uniref:DeoR/GlpR transcriptional regulator n=1 Tax=Massilia forsythiae TaxID=2728020 RepID=A0A7Z2ZTV8_9BURK|nr:DeoR/GlpR family DNA-binding transcription regulator [Massilia forsythiae]QJE00417.1 DeoR/GlpR transcriptional regulator [Massilia forsythiae]